MILFLHKFLMISTLGQTDMEAHACKLGIWKAELCGSSKRTQARGKPVSKTKTKAKPSQNEKAQRNRQTLLGFQSSEVNSVPHSEAILTCTGFMADKLN